MDRDQEQQRLRDEERVEEQNRLREEQAEIDRRELDEEERQEYDAAMRRYQDEQYRKRDDEERAKRYQEEREEHYQAEVQEVWGVLPPVTVDYDPYLYKMYEIMGTWRKPDDVMLIRTLAFNPYRIFTYRLIKDDHVLSCWSHAGFDSQGVLDQLDQTAAHLRERIAEKS